MFGSAAFSELAFCEQAIAFVPPPAPDLIQNDGFKRGERRKYQELSKKLERAQELRMKSALKEKEQLLTSITRQVAPELLPQKKAKEIGKPAAPLRQTIHLKSPDLFDADIANYIREINQINRLRWFRIAREYEERMEAMRLAELDDEETLLLLI